jgi:hypothetical protein
MKVWSGVTGLLLAVVVLLPGCASRIKVEHQFPDVVAAPRDMSVALVVDQEFRNYNARPDSKTQIDIGTAQVELFSKALQGLFSQVVIVSPEEMKKAGTNLVIIPSVQEVQLSSPTESYLNVFEVWIKYSLDIQSGDGVPIDSWFLPAYGKTPYSFMLSRTNAIETATVMALRDAGAKLVLDFFRIPAVFGWMQQRQAAQSEQ